MIDDLLCVYVHVPLHAIVFIEKGPNFETVVKGRRSFFKESVYTCV